MKPHALRSVAGRRACLGATLGGAVFVAHGCATGHGAQHEPEREDEGEDVSVGEDLVREHGALAREFGVYDLARFTGA